MQKLDPNSFVEKVGIDLENKPVNNVSIEITHRKLSQRSYRILHFLIYSTSLIHSDSPLNKYNVLEHLECDWNSLCKMFNTGDRQISALFHQILFRLHRISLPNISSIYTLKQREEFEEIFQKQIVEPVISNLNENVFDFFEKVQNKSEEIINTTFYRLEETNNDKEELKMKMLLRKTPEITTEQFNLSMHLNGNTLFFFLRERISDLEPLKHLYNLLSWQKQISSHFKGKITLKEADELSLETVFNLKVGIEESDFYRPFTKTHFEDLSNSWNSIRDKVTSFLCDQNLKVDERNTFFFFSKICFNIQKNS